MALMGRAAVVIWCELEGDRGAHDDWHSHEHLPERVGIAGFLRGRHDDWHSHEHLPERVGIAGFLRGRRSVSVDGSAPQVMAMYEVETPATLTSPAYLERLNHPTPWSARIMASVRRLSRTLCRVSASHGSGLGTQSLTIAFSPQRERADALRGWFAERLPGLVSQPGLTGAHLLEREAGAEPPSTEEQRLRGRRDLEVDAVLLVEGYDAAALDRLAATALSTQQLVEHGAVSPLPRRWQLAHVMTGADLAP